MYTEKRRGLMLEIKRLYHIRDGQRGRTHKCPDRKMPRDAGGEPEGRGGHGSRGKKEASRRRAHQGQQRPGEPKKIDRHSEFIRQHLSSAHFGQRVPGVFLRAQLLSLSSSEFKVTMSQRCGPSQMFPVSLGTGPQGSPRGTPDSFQECRPDVF